MGNAWHSLADFVGGFMVLDMLEVVRDPSNLQIVLLDARVQCFEPCIPDCEGPLGEIWRAIGNGAELRRATDFSGTNVCFREALFSWTSSSMIWGAFGGPTPCGESRIMQRYRTQIRDYFAQQLPLLDTSAGESASRPVMLLSIRKQSVFGNESLKRKYRNEEEMVSRLEEWYGTRFIVRTVDFSTISIGEQVNLMGTVSVFIGMHGAGMTNLLYMPSVSGCVIETIPHNGAGSNGFRNLAKYTDQLYFAWESPHASNDENRGEWTTVDMESLRPSLDAAAFFAERFRVGEAKGIIDVEQQCQEARANDAEWAPHCVEAAKNFGGSSITNAR